MPVFNAENFISSAIQSILNQDYANIELIICNDNSNDRTLEIIKFYQLISERITLISNKKRLGVAESLNKLMKKANGDYIARIDSDDISLQGRISYQVKKLKEKKVDFISNGIKYFGKRRNKILFHRPNLNSIQIKSRLLFYNPINHPTVLFKRSVREHISYDTKNEGFEDWACWLKLMNTNIKMLCDKKIVLKYRIHQNNYSKLYDNRKDRLISRLISKNLNINLISLDCTLKKIYI